MTNDCAFSGRRNSSRDGLFVRRDSEARKLLIISLAPRNLVDYKCNVLFGAVAGTWERIRHDERCSWAHLSRRASRLAPSLVGDRSEQPLEWQPCSRRGDMTVMRTAIMILLLLPAVAPAQTKEEKDEQEGKVSNDSPARPLQMPPASTETKEAIDDFDRFQRRGAWERALKSLYTIPEDQTRRFIDGENNFIVPIERNRRSTSGHAPNGQAACRLFYDAEAKKLFDEASGPTELKNLERVYSAYFITSVGDNAADRLGDLYFEQGQFDRAPTAGIGP